jgi:hypothetical protein
MKEFLQVLFFLLQKLDLRLARSVQCFACGRLNKLTIQAADLTVCVVELTLENFDLVLGLF